MMHGAMYQQSSEHVAAKEIFQQLLDILRVAQHGVNQIDKLWLARAVLNQTLQDTATIDVNRD